jgi:glycine betaine/proline transport system ATP-binding protein
VNRSKVLNATHACNEPSLTLTMRSRPAHAAERLAAQRFEYAAVLDGNRLAGVLTHNAAERAVREGAREIATYVKDMATVSASAGLGEVLGRMLSSTEPLAVTGEGDEFLGLLSRRKVVELVTPALEAAHGKETGLMAESPEETDCAAGAKTARQRVAA